MHFLFNNVCIDAIVHDVPPHVMSSSDIETELAPVYERLRLPEGRLELMTGIRERRFYDPGTKPGQISQKTVKLALKAAGLELSQCGALLHGSVCRDQMEPATATGVHAWSGLPNDAMVLDISNACLGLLNGAVFIANMIELGQIQAGVVVGTEIGRPLVEATIAKLLNDPGVTRKSIKGDIASLTIGSGSAAIVLCHSDLSKTGNRLLGGACLADTSHHELCAGGVEENTGDNRPLMSTDSEALLHAGVGLAATTWQETKQALGWSNGDVSRVITHQVGKAHRQLLLETLGLPAEIDFPTIEVTGNTGAAALPTAAAMALQQGAIRAGDQVAFLGIGSGLNSMMLGIDWKA